MKSLAIVFEVLKHTCQTKLNRIYYFCMVEQASGLYCTICVTFRILHCNLRQLLFSFDTFEAHVQLLHVSLVQQLAGKTQQTCFWHIRPSMCFLHLHLRVCQCSPQVIHFYPEKILHLWDNTVTTLSHVFS